MLFLQIQLVINADALCLLAYVDNYDAKYSEITQATRDTSLYNINKVKKFADDNVSCKQ